MKIINLYYSGFTVFAYLFGSIPFGYWLVKIFKGIDIRRFGSGNIGATNVYRVAGKGLGIFTFILDVFKGVIPVLILKKISYVNFSPLFFVFIGIITIIGHNYSIFLKGKGGKGVSCSFGVILALFPVAAACSFLLWSLIFLISGYVSFGSIIAAFFLPFFIFIFNKNSVYVITGMLIFFIILFAHRSNIKRLLTGKENKIKLW
ncbi:MAG: glycerol-3-phosphate 1-O-acyltransferase PlsY [Candidatus Omnitrophica bacterium]|nr:glycerol-3-phosphate 1-O-acyltransferase PlsY [Candidatus Omnitrophota bacterium]